MTSSGRRAPSARARIVGAVVLLVAAAFAGSVAWSAQILAAQADALVDQRLSHAADSFRTFAQSPSGRSQFTVDQLLTRYLQDTVTSPGETKFSLVDGTPRRRASGTPPARLDRDPAFLHVVRGREEPVHGRFDTAAGQVSYAVIPVRVAGDPRQGAMVAIQFRQQLTRPLFDALGIFAAAGGLAVIGSGLASWLVAGRVLAPVRLVRETAESISETDLHGRIAVVGTDDVAALASTFNRMLDRLETAFATQQQFVDDAGHELRTPITVVRGHLEMMGNSPGERRATVALVTDELDRMARIVNDLLVLAKAGQPDFVVRSDVDITDLLVDTLAKARMLGRRRWVLDELAEGSIRADGQRLTQALMQLATNAVAHTPPDGTIGFGSRTTAGSLLLWVRDTGSGMTAAEQQGIFDRFRRSSGPRTVTGAGLGLAIVKSIAEAHGGRVSVHSSKGVGSTFELALPLLPPPREPPKVSDDWRNPGRAQHEPHLDR